MFNSWTFGRKLGVGFAVVVLMSIISSAVGLMALRSVSSAKDEVLDQEAMNAFDGARLEAAANEIRIAVLLYLRNRDEGSLRERVKATKTFWEIHKGIVQRSVDEESRRAAQAVVEPQQAYDAAVDRLEKMVASGAKTEEIDKALDAEKRADAVASKAVVDLYQHELSSRDEKMDASNKTADMATAQVSSMLAIAVILTLLIAVFLTRSVSRQVGSAVTHMESSSVELQTAANQAASGAKENATAMNEITTTIRELLSTAHQIAESAQRVAQIADETGGAGRAGEEKVEKARSAIRTIQAQVELIVKHMLDLGRKSQQIGGVLDIINELAEQTNILAINATIEAIGAGEAGKRFSVVAEEIRKLADRVAESTKEIRGLIDEVRASVNTTVMTTETGSKAVAAGSEAFDQLASSFGNIVALVTTTLDAAREIELSTKQQSSAVEQVTSAVSNVAQTTKEAETSATQTLQTTTELATLARDLTRMIRPQAAA